MGGGDLGVSGSPGGPGVVQRRCRLSSGGSSHDTLPHAHGGCRRCGRARGGLGRVANSTGSDTPTGGSLRVVPRPAERWSHHGGGTPPQVVPSPWRTTDSTRGRPGGTIRLRVTLNGDRRRHSTTSSSSGRFVVRAAVTYRAVPGPPRATGHARRNPRLCGSHAGTATVTMRCTNPFGGAGRKECALRSDRRPVGPATDTNGPGRSPAATGDVRSAQSGLASRRLRHASAATPAAAATTGRPAARGTSARDGGGGAETGVSPERSRATT
jgi:hypothetical protein